MGRSLLSTTEKVFACGEREVPQHAARRYSRVAFLSPSRSDPNKALPLSKGRYPYLVITCDRLYLLFASEWARDRIFFQFAGRDIRPSEKAL